MHIHGWDVESFMGTTGLLSSCCLSLPSPESSMSPISSSGKWDEHCTSQPIVGSWGTNLITHVNNLASGWHKLCLSVPFYFFSKSSLLLFVIH